MSVINNALTNIANKESGGSSTLKRAEVPTQKRSGKLAWAVGGFTLSLALGGWAVSTQMSQSNPENVVPDSVLVNEPSMEVAPLPASAEPLTENNLISEKTHKPGQPEAESPTTKVTMGTSVPLYGAENKELSVSEPEIQASSSLSHVVEAQASAKQPVQPEVHSPVKPEPIPNLNKVETVAKKKPIATAKARKREPVLVEPGSLEVKQVELTPEQISRKSVERAKRALDSNDLKTAIEEYEKALKYTPSDDDSRRKLAALYYGKQNVRKSVDVLRHGIRLDESNQKLRIALSKILIREGQPEAALSPLVYLPANPSIDYLSLRAGLAQQAKINDIALETYQLLVTKEGDNARWWLGLAIQQEREQRYQEAIHSYTQALGRIGVSKNTQSFIRDRLSLLNNLVRSKDAD